MYGFLRGLLSTLKQAQREQRQWVYGDRGYLRASYGTDFSGYFRLTRNAYQLDGLSMVRSQKRWENLSLTMAPWKRGSHVLVCPPGDVFTAAVGGFTAAQWLRDTLAKLAQHTDRKVVIRHKPPQPGVGRPLSTDLQDCHALVTYMSNTAVEAVLAGVPVFCTGRSAARAVGRTDLKDIESPVYPDRQIWAATLAANQWTLDEIRRGIPNEVLYI